MKNLIKYFSLVLCLLSVAGCNEDEKSFSLKPSLGFATPALQVLNTKTTPSDVALYTNVTRTEFVTVTIGVTNTGSVKYNEDYVTDPEPVSGVITLEIDPEDPTPGFTITPLQKSDVADIRNIFFEILSVSGNGLSMAQQSALLMTYTIAKKQLEPNQLNISDVRAMYTGSDITIAEDKFIEGVVISNNDNVTGKNVFIQDETGGIVLRFNTSNATAGNKLVLKDLVRVPLKNVTLTAFNGLLQLGNGSTTLPNESVSKMGTADLPEPKVITVAQLNSNAYQSQRVRILNVTFNGADGTKTVLGNTTFSDDGGTTSSTMRVETYSPFATKVLPTGTVTISGIANTFTTAQILPIEVTDIP